MKKEYHSNKESKIKRISEKFDENYKKALEMLLDITSKELKNLREGNLEQKERAYILL